ncbi:MAG: 2-oxo-4-hydroxy-4-carboxy-5-ureidoimidazoline decarboxylase [Flavobacteriaceae bacterium]|nr:2-oxo-4-hydroxy-4-carboxy-5-ureidoimidazoline decarboxylase [Flavobacteriaceae bacterium]
MNMTLNEFNKLTKQEAIAELEKCCVSKCWVQYMIENMPFASSNELILKTVDIWYHQCRELDWQAAFEGHPKIGNIASLKEKFSNTKNWATNEQSNIVEADKNVLKALAKANDDYLNKFGYIFIVSASGKSAKEMLSIINARLDNTKEDELHVAMGEQHKITVIRLAKLIDDIETTADLRSYITTHVLDTTTGIPGKNVQIILNGFTDGFWKPITVGVTNNDGRIADLLPPGKKLKAGKYQMVFDTASYYKSQQQEGFYPEVAILFEVTNHDHYHVPLLLNPYGYTTYRGS